MYLFILESIGTSELLLIGVIALIFLGPRRMPEMARKIGKIMAEFRGTANEFKDTWKREVDFEEEKKALDLNAIESEPIARVTNATPSEPPAEAPSIKPIDSERLEQLKAAAEAGPPEEKQETPPPPPSIDETDKQNWL